MKTNRIVFAAAATAVAVVSLSGAQEDGTC